MDRFLVFSAKPIFNKTTTLRENLERIKDSPLQEIASVMETIYLQHKGGQRYSLSQDAQAHYDEMVDGYAEFIRDKYASDDGKYRVISLQQEHNGCSSFQNPNL